VNWRAALTTMKIAWVSARPLFLNSRVDRDAARAGEMHDQLGIVAHAQMMDRDSTFFQRGNCLGYNG